MAGDDHESAGVLERLQDIEDRRGALGVEPPKRLIHQQDLRLGHERRGHLRLLQHAAGVGANEVGPPLIQPDRVQQLRNALVAGVVMLAALPQDPRQQLLGREVRRKLRLGVYEAHVRQKAIRMRVDVKIAVAHGTGGRKGQRGEQAQQRGLPGPVRPDQAGGSARRKRPF